MKHIATLFIAAALLVSCATNKGRRYCTPLRQVLCQLAKDSLCAHILSHPESYEVQIIYTQIDRDAQGVPSFRSYWYQVDSSRYFYPASTVKLPVALLALEKLNRLRQNGWPELRKETPYRIDSLRPYQQLFVEMQGSPLGRPCIAHDVRQIFLTSDNLAYNRCFEFLGREYINQVLRDKGYTRTGIVHRFNYPKQDNRLASPVAFLGPMGDTIYFEGEKADPKLWLNPQHHTKKGIAYLDLNDSLVMQPFDMTAKNWFALTDMEKILKAVMFPQAVPEHQRFALAADDYPFLWKQMGIFPRESVWPPYDSSYYDSYVKFLVMGDDRGQQSGQVRSFNKVGFAYGTVTDVAYIVDFERNIEFILVATILCNKDGVFNDGRYDYDEVGIPFLAKLGRAVLEHETKRKRLYPPNLEPYRAVFKQ